jgi:DNA polymerase I-like protein with 3'-5' exonuclease and polymerase domains
MIASLVLNNEQSGLKWLTENILKTKQIQYDDISQNNKYQMDQLDVETVGFYACMDADYTLQLGNIFERRIKERNIEPLFKLEMIVLRTLLKMEREGVGIDIDYLEDLEPEYESKILELSKIML